MDREQEEAVLRITAQYVEEVKAGHQPKVSEYIARHPQYGDEIADFAAYYHAYEVHLPVETNVMPELAEEFRIAMDSAYQRVLQHEHKLTDQLTTLLVTKDNKLLTLSHLARTLNVSIDIATKLEQRKIKVSSIPNVLLSHLAEVLQQPLHVIRAYFARDHLLPTSLSLVAEAKMPYQVDEHTGERVESFRGAVEESPHLSEKQKHTWYEVLNQEGL